MLVTDEETVATETVTGWTVVLMFDDTCLSIIFTALEGTDDSIVWGDSVGFFATDAVVFAVFELDTTSFGELSFGISVSFEVDLVKGLISFRCSTTLLLVWVVDEVERGLNAKFFFIGMFGLFVGFGTGAFFLLGIGGVFFKVAKEFPVSFLFRQDLV